MSDTPRTDVMQRIQFEGCECVVAAQENTDSWDKAHLECAYIARKLKAEESELTALRKENERMKPMCARYDWLITNSTEACWELERELTALRQVAEAVRMDDSGRSGHELLREAASILNVQGGGPIADCLISMAEKLEAHLDGRGEGCE